MNATSGNVPYFWTSGRLCDFDGCDRPDFFPKNINGWFWSANQVCSSFPFSFPSSFSFSSSFPSSFPSSSHSLSPYPPAPVQSFINDCLLFLQHISNERLGWVHDRSLLFKMDLTDLFAVQPLIVSWSEYLCQVVLWLNILFTKLQHYQLFSTNAWP